LTQALVNDLGQLIERARALDARPGRALLGIAGPPGGGKSTLASAVVAAVGDRARLLGLDGFHLSQAELRRLGRRERMGAIDTFDAAAFVGVVRRLAAAPEETVRAPVFDRTVEESTADALRIEPGVRLVVIEGNYLLATTPPWVALVELLDEVWYCEREEGARLRDLVARHRRYGKSAEQARRWASGSDQRNAELIAASRARAAVIARLEGQLS
jgi:pantothenate kinase